MTTAFIDADILVYEAAFRAETTIEWEPGDASSYASLEQAQVDFMQTVASVTRLAGCDANKLTLTTCAREDNFRHHLWPTYKENRKDGRRPVLHAALREWVLEEYAPVHKPNIEADDVLGILATKYPGNVIVSIDKDLDTVPGLHYNWRKPDLGVYDVTPEEAAWNHLYQTLVGDSTDGFPGCRGIGPKRAVVVLNGQPLDDGKGLWSCVVEAFEKKGLSEEEALVQARCAYILQRDDYIDGEVQLWTP